MSKSLFAIKIQGIENLHINKFTYIILKHYYKLVHCIAGSLSKIIQYPNSLHRFINNNLRGKFYRKICMLDIVYFNKYSTTYKCNCCGRTVLKGIIRDCTILNCPGCGSQYTLYKNTHGHIINCCSSNKNIVDKDTIIDNGIRYDEKILGKTINVKNVY